MQRSEGPGAFLNDGEMGERISTHDWEATSLGPMSAWPLHLRTTLAVLLHLPRPAVLFWGRQGSMFYNDSFIPFAGSLHPALLGREAASEEPIGLKFASKVRERGFSHESFSLFRQEFKLQRDESVESVAFDIDCAAIPDEKGHSAGILSICVESSHEPAVDYEPGASEAFIAAINNSARALIAVFDLRSTRIVYANSYLCELLGYSPEEVYAMTGKETMAMVHPEDIPALSRTLDECRHATEGARLSIEFRKRHRNGEYRWVHADATPFGARDGNGASLQILYVMEDITERKYAEELLQESEKRMRLATEAARAFTWEMDIDTGKLSFSSNIESVLGFTLPEEGMQSRQFIHADDLHVVDEFQRAVKGEKKYDVEYRLVDPRSGECIWLHSQGHAFGDTQHRKTRFIGITQNINERKRAELNTAFLAEISADFAMLKGSEEIMRVAVEKISRHLDVSELFFFEINDTTDEAEVLYEWSERKVKIGKIVHSLADFMDAATLRTLKNGEIAVVDRSDRCAEARIYAPYFSHGRWRFMLIVQRQLARRWRTDEADLVRDLSRCIWSCLERAQAEDALRESEERYRTLFESIDEGFCLVDMLFDPASRQWDLLFQEANPAFEKHSGLKRAVGKTLREIAPDADPAWFDIFSGVALSGEPVRFDSYAKTLNRWFGIHAFRFGKSDAHRLGIVFTDITHRKRMQEELAVSNERMKMAIEGAGDGIWEWDIEQDVNTVSKRWKQILGFEEHEFPDSREEWRRRIHPEDMSRVLSSLDACLEGITPSFTCEYRVKCKDGRWKWVVSRGVVVARDDHHKPLRMAGTMTDISERKQADELIWHHANFDMLTGLPNRRLFRDRLDQEVRKAHRTKRRLGLLFIDLDRFKQVNDLLGHDAGDLLLVTAAQRLKGCVRESDTVARLGGDEFTVILTEFENISLVEQVSQKILDALSSPFHLGKEIAYLSGSIGITLYPGDATSSEELIRKADQAMYAAKNAGKNRFSFFLQSMDERAHLRLKLANELRSALREGQLEVYYQPVVDIPAGRIVKAEALLRWNHPAMGLIGPAEFIPLAEESGIISEIGNWVFREAASCSKRWGAKLGTPFQIGVNKSPVQFLSHIEHEDWQEYLEQLGLPKRSISVEITEGLLLHASNNVTNKLLEYRDAGIQVAIDDFGTGYSSMAYLKKFDIDYLKIDQSFIRDMEKDAGNRTIAESIIVMAHKLGLQVIAEGIETVEQKELLSAAGCDYGQGFLFSRPVSADEFEELLIANVPFSANNVYAQHNSSLPH